MKDTAGKTEIAGTEQTGSQKNFFDKLKSPAPNMARGICDKVR